jgi:hypothetical protein
LKPFTDSLRFKTLIPADSIKLKIKLFSDSLDNRVQLFMDSIEYETFHTVEYEAHHKIEPVVEKFYQDYRCTYFNGIIDNSEKCLIDALNDLSIAKGPKIKEYQKNVHNLQLEKDKWVYGTLYKP